MNLEFRFMYFNRITAQAVFHMIHYPLFIIQLEKRLTTCA